MSAAIAWKKSDAITPLDPKLQFSLAMAYVAMKRTDWARQQLEKLYENSPRIERLGRIAITHLFLQREEWEHECLRLDTRERFLHFVQNNPDLMQRVPQKFLASYLNMKPETFSRLKHLIQRPRAAVREK